MATGKESINISSETSIGPKNSTKEEVLFKNGKIWVIDNHIAKSSEINKTEKFFKKGNVGYCVISARLKPEKSTGRSETNYLKIVEKVIKKGWKPENVVKTGFHSVDLCYANADIANKIYSEMCKDEDIDCNILERNLEARGIIRDWVKF